MARRTSTSALAFGRVACLLVATAFGMPLTTLGQDNDTPANESVAEANELAQRKSDPRTLAVRELIYQLRESRVFDRSNEWGGQIRELVQIGKPAVPELVAELDRTESNTMLRAVPFTLRAINDPRAMPALIRAIPKTCGSFGSDCGVSFSDPEIQAFMRQHDRYPDEDDSVSWGRPVNELMDTLSRISGHEEPPAGQRDPLRHSRDPADFQRRQEHWQKWWDEHWREFVTEEELASVDLAATDEDLVKEAGLKRFGPTFANGPDVRLEPVCEVTLQRSTYWDAPSHIDFDTGRVYEVLEDAAGHDQRLWMEDRGIDAREAGVVTGDDLHIWMIPNERWDSIGDEVRGGQMLDMGKRVSSYLVPKDDEGEWLHREIGTFLFTTREGGRGIARVFPADAAGMRRLLYRMWSRDEPLGTATAEVDAEADAETPLGLGPVMTATLSSSIAGEEFLLDLETGQTSAPPAELVPAGDKKGHPFHQNQLLVNWCHDRGIELGAGVSKIASEDPADLARTQCVQLIGPGMRARRVLTKSFDTMTAERVSAIMSRGARESAELVYMSTFDGSVPLPHAFAIVTRDGHPGILQIIEEAEDCSSIKIQYRLAK